MSTLTTHVLDTALGKPAARLNITLESQGAGGAWEAIGSGETDADGRLKTLVPGGKSLAAGVYRITFDTGEYMRRLEAPCFYPTVPVIFEIGEAAQHYHVPLLISPYGYSTYRGS